VHFDKHAGKLYFFMSSGSLGQSAYQEADRLAQVLNRQRLIYGPFGDHGQAPERGAWGPDTEAIAHAIETIPGARLTKDGAGVEFDL
jgi:hypothetical protein